SYPSHHTGNAGTAPETHRTAGHSTPPRAVGLLTPTPTAARNVRDPVDRPAQQRPSERLTPAATPRRGRATCPPPAARTRSPPIPVGTSSPLLRSRRVPPTRAPHAVRNGFPRTGSRSAPRTALSAPPPR